MEYLAHLNKKINEKQLLKEHLIETAQMNADAIPFEILGFKNISREDIKRIAFLSGLFHDTGKYTDYFQNYLQNEVKSRYRPHSHVSACMLYNWLNHEYPTYKFDRNDQKNSHNIVQKLLAYTAVKTHHGNLSKITIDSNLPCEDEILTNIYKNISKSEKLIKEELMLTNNIIKLTKSQFLKEKVYFSTAIHLLHSRIKSVEWFFYLQLIFSILVDNDKLNSAGISRTQNTLKKPELVTDYIQKKNDKTSQKENRINNKREAFRKSVLNKIETLSDTEIESNGIYTITAPTGIGKTLTSIQAAILLSNRLNKIHKYTPRIITAIPFINIIEQTKMDYRNIFGEENVLVHHRFAISEDKEDDEKDINKDYLNLESWNAEIVLTTFVQLFHSVLTGKNRLLKKLNKFVGSIVILDEIQSIPEQYYPLVGWLLKHMADYYSTKFILMTATKPKIIEFANKIPNQKTEITSIELFEENKKYFTAQNRTQLVPILESKMTIEELVDFIAEKYQNTGSMLIVVNTIRRSLEVYNTLKEYYKNQDVEILYLSTNIIPKSRQKVIERAKELLDTKNRVIMVSTQTIEAGVDLDFDQGIRDMAPLASIIQTAGRINREGEKSPHRPLYVVNIENDAELVYRMHNNYYTNVLLKKAINEEDYYDTIETYYAKQLIACASDESIKIVEEGIMKLDYEVIEEFELIKNLPGIVDVFVECDKEATELADRYEKIRRELREVPKEQKYDYKIKLKNILKKMGKYIISVRTNRLKDGNKPPEFYRRNEIDADFLWIPLDEVFELYYSKETGFKDESGSAFIF